MSMTSNTFDDAMMQMAIKLLEIVHSTNVVVEGKIGNLSELPEQLQDKNLVELIKVLLDSAKTEEFKPEHHRLLPANRAIRRGNMVAPMYTTEPTRVVVKEGLPDLVKLIIRNNGINEINLAEYFVGQYDIDYGKFPELNEIGFSGDKSILANPPIVFTHKRDKAGNPIIKPLMRIDSKVVKNTNFSVTVNGHTVGFTTLHDGIINIQRYLDELVVIDDTLKHPDDYCNGVMLESLRVRGYTRGAGGSSVYQTPYRSNRSIQYFSGSSNDININPFDVSYKNVTIDGGMFNIFDESYDKNSGYVNEYFIVDSIEVVYKGATYTRTFDNQSVRQTNLNNLRSYVDKLVAVLRQDLDYPGIDVYIPSDVNVPEPIVHIFTSSGDDFSNSRNKHMVVGRKSGNEVVPGPYAPYIGRLTKSDKISITLSKSQLADAWISNVDNVVVEFKYLDNVVTRTIPISSDNIKLNDILAYDIVSSGREYMSSLYTRSNTIELEGSGNYSFSFSEGFIKSLVMEFEPNGFNPSQIVKKDGIVVNTNNWTITSTVVDASRTSFKTGIDLTTPTAKLIPKNMVLKFGNGIKDIKQSINRVTIYRD